MITVNEHGIPVTGRHHNKIYGSSVLPEHFFRFDPATNESIDFGQCRKRRTYLAK